MIGGNRTLIHRATIYCPTIGRRPTYQDRLIAYGNRTHVLTVAELCLIHLTNAIFLTEFAVTVLLKSFSDSEAFLVPAQRIEL